MMWFIAASLLLQPVLAEPTDVRLVATGTGEQPVEWHVDGRRLAVTNDSEPATVRLPAGAHDLWAVTSHDGSWQVLARPDHVPGPGIHEVPAWTAHHQGHHASGPVLWPWLAVAAGVVAVARRRPKRP